MDSKKLKKSTWLLIALGVLLVGIGFAAGYFENASKTHPNIVSIRDPQSGYPLINPVLYTELPESLSFPKYTPLDNALMNYVNAATGANKASAISVYYRDLESGNWVDVNPSDTFDPASMLKVVTLIAVLYQAETLPSLLSATVNIDSGVQLTSLEQDYYPPANPVRDGSSYTVQQLLQQMITQSDDGANALLMNYIGNNAMTTVASDLQVPAPGESTEMTTRQYSHLFRVLYNATYLTPADSESALQLLTQTAFKQGLVAGVPTGTTVAHKFGEATTGNVHELHDCGIIYYPQHPYFLCIMTRGSDFPTLAGIIAGLSQVAWQQTDTLYPH